jgi:hypothetical protein
MYERAQGHIPRSMLEEVKEEDEPGIEEGFDLARELEKVDNDLLVY